jgi:Amidohydrolase family
MCAVARSPCWKTWAGEIEAACDQLPAAGRDAGAEPGLRPLPRRRPLRPAGRFPGSGNLTLRQAFHAQTVAAAWLGCREHCAGVLAPGYDADFAVLDTGDVLAAAPAELASLAVLRTVVGGRTVYGGRLAWKQPFVQDNDPDLPSPNTAWSPGHSSRMSPGIPARILWLGPSG